MALCKVIHVVHTGRAIRHAKDYASILLLDQRYLRPSITTKLPTWISRSLQTCDKFGPAFSALRKVSYHPSLHLPQAYFQNSSMFPRKVSLNLGYIPILTSHAENK